MKKAIFKQIVQIAKSRYETHPEYNRFIHYSFIIQDNKISAIGMNKPLNPPVHFGYGKKFGKNSPNMPKLHSELDAFFKIKYNHKPFNVINIRLSRNGDVMLSKPCNCCSAFLSNFKCNSIYYSTNSGEFKEHKLYN